MKKSKAKGFVKNMKNEVEETFVSIFKKTFTKENLETHKKYVSKKAHPHYFDNTILEDYTLRYVDTRLMRLGDIIMDNKQGQEVRQGRNERGPAIKACIQERGWSLLIPEQLSVILKDDGTYSLHDGRNREGILRALGWNDDSLVIVHVYKQLATDIKSLSKQLSHRYSENKEEYPRGLATREDMIATMLLHLSVYPLFEGNESDENYYDDLITYKKNLRKEIKEWLRLMKESITDKNINDCIEAFFNKHGQKINTVPFDDHNAAKKYAYDVLGVKDTRKYRHVFVSTDAYAPYKSIITDLRENGPLKKGQEIRIITFTGNLAKEGADTAKNFYKKNIGSGERIDSYMAVFMESATDNPIKGIKYKAYGTIPQCHELSNKFPMNKLIKYDELSEETLEMGRNKDDKKL